MLVYAYSEARQKFADVLDKAMSDEVIIRRRNGDEFRITPIQKVAAKSHSPFDVPGIDTGITLDEILDDIHASREHRA
jgi:prevent-host-death family protein